ncbi:MAG: hypothetical protein EA396_11170 [Anaerolineaceae bacterium]|nr:MAG: hypothetical protein EA396_11170 [Anaerolineaceae bacterium]
MKTFLDTINIKNTAKSLLFVMLVTFMLFMASHISETASITLSNADPFGFNENLCYSACAFIR